MGAFIGIGTAKIQTINLMILTGLSINWKKGTILFCSLPEYNLPIQRSDNRENYSI
jgi:hypothetical protein